MQKPVIVLTLAYSAGLLLGNAFLYFPYSTGFLTAAAILTAILLTFPGRRSFRRLLFVTLPCSAGIAAYLYSAAWLPADHYTRLIPDTKAVHEISGRIVSALDRDPDRTSFVLRVDRIDGISVSGRIRVSVREAVTSIGYGDVIRVSGRLFKPAGFRNPGGFDYPRYLARSGTYRTVSVRSEEHVGVIVPGGGLFRTIQNWRELIRRSFLASTSGPGSAILQAMVLGEEGALTDELRDRFLAAGVTHIISISGSHLGMVALICFGFLRLLIRLLPERTYHLLTLHAEPRKIAAWCTLPLVVFYTLLAGGQMATIRSLMMIVSVLAALILDRDNALLHSLAAAALFILIASPQAIFDISFQLSFVSVFSIGFVVLVGKELQTPPAGVASKAGRNALLLMIISFTTSLATGPLVVHYFNQFSLAGIVSNIVVVPFAGMAVVPLGLLSGVLSLFTGSLPLAGLNQALADLFIGTVNFFSRLPIAEFHPPSPGVLWLLAYALLIISTALVIRSRLFARFKPFEHSLRVPRLALAGIGVAGLLLIAAAAPVLLQRDRVKVSFPDVGQGDASLIQLPGGKSILIDGGGVYDDRFDIGRSILAPFLWNSGVRQIDLVILSHPHPDHMNGLKFILKKFRVAQVWTHGMDEGLPGYDELLRSIRSGNIEHRVMSAEDAPCRLGDAELRVLHPGKMFRSKEKKAYAAENDRSMVVRIAVHDRTLLFTGDIGKGGEKALLRQGENVKCDLLKVPHHGSRSSSSMELLEAARPSFAVVTAGRGNPYHHPSGDVLERYETIGSRILRTDRDGALFIEIDDAGLRTTRWNDLELMRVDDIRHISLEREKENWKKLLLRKWEL
jgi:competence protein ComEC